VLDFIAGREQRGRDPHRRHQGKQRTSRPKQALANHIDARADLWSMGVVFWAPHHVASSRA
jgi:hypothetical protein